MSDLQVNAGKPEQENSVYTAMVSILVQDFLASLIEKHIQEDISNFPSPYTTN